MGCCGKTIEKAKNIVIGYTLTLFDKHYEFADDRTRTCHKCEEQTWLSRAEYLGWLAKHGIQVANHFTELEKLRKLPKCEYSKKRGLLFCRLCKCWIPAKARIKDESCLLGKWENK